MKTTLNFLESGSPLDMEGEVFPGVSGYAIKCGLSIYIPFVEAKKKGAFSAMLKECNRLMRGGYRIKLPTVISQKLAEILISKGYEVEYEHDGVRKERVEIFVLDIRNIYRRFHKKLSEDFSNLHIDTGKLSFIWRRNLIELRFN